MKNIFKPVALLFVFSLVAAHSNAQLLNKLKKKAENAVTKPSDKQKEEEPKTETAPAETKKNSDVVAENKKTETAAIKNANPSPSVFEESDFIPGSTVLYADDFKNEENGDLPKGWLTTSSAEVVGINGLAGKWLKMASVNSTHITRNKKQSWGNSYTVEFDIVIVKNDYDPRINFLLINTGGSLVTDEMILRGGKHMAYVSTILGDGGKLTRVSLYNNNNINNPISDRMSEQLMFTNYVPVHVSMCVQGKRFRFWWNEKKIIDAQCINEQYVPNQLAIQFGNVGGSDYYISNIRVAKDIPATRPAKTTTDNAATNVTEPTSTDTKPVSSDNSPAVVNFQSKTLTTSLPYAQIMKTGEYSYTFTASKEEGNNKENFFKIKLETGNTALKAETFNFKEINQKNPLYGTKQYPEITATEAVLYYGAAQKPYIFKFSPIIANAPMASFVSASLARNLPAPSSATKLVIEKVIDGKASGYFVMGIMIQGLKPVTKGDAMTETFTTGFSGEVKCTFSNVPVY